jgi:hypothetical protein
MSVVHQYWLEARLTFYMQRGPPHANPHLQLPITHKLRLRRLEDWSRWYRRWVIECLIERRWQSWNVKTRYAFRLEVCYSYNFLYALEKFAEKIWDREASDSELGKRHEPLRLRPWAWSLLRLELELEHTMHKCLRSTSPKKKKKRVQPVYNVTDKYEQESCFALWFQSIASIKERILVGIWIVTGMAGK